MCYSGDFFDSVVVLTQTNMVNKVTQEIVREKNRMNFDI